MADLVLDTDALADFLAQYFGRANRGREDISESSWLSRRAVVEINRILCRFRSRDSLEHLVVASAFAFVELVRKWDQLMRDRITPEQLKAFLNEPPAWFDVAPVDEDLVEDFLDVPAEVAMPSGEAKPIEWTDAIHVATTFSRHPDSLITTQDQRIAQILRLRGRVV